MIGELTDKLRSQYTGSGLHQFLIWWRDELVLLLPERLRAAFRYEREWLAIIPGDGELLFWRCGGDAPAELGRLDLSDELPLARQQIARFQSELDNSEARMVLCLPGEQSLSKRLTFPAATEENLRQVLAYEMDRQTPFKADQVFFDYRVVGRDLQRRRISVDLLLSPRREVEDLLHALQDRGLQPHAVDVLEANGEVTQPRAHRVNLLPPDRRAKGNNRQWQLNVALAAVAVALLSAVMWQSLANKAETLKALEAQVAGARDDAMEARELRDQLADATEAANFLVRRKEQHPVLVDVIRSVTKVLPDDTWVRRFQLRGKDVILQGESEQASELIGLFEKATEFAGASMRSPVTSMPNSNVDRFNLEVTVDVDEEGSDAEASGKG